MSTYRIVGGRLGAYIRSNNPSTQQIQGFLGDLLANDELLLPMRDVVARPSFTALRDFAGSGGGVIQRDALLQDLARSYLSNVVDGVGQLINGMLDQPAGQTIYADSAPQQVQSRPLATNAASQQHRSTRAAPVPDWGWEGYDSSEESPKAARVQTGLKTSENQEAKESERQRIKDNKLSAGWILLSIFTVIAFLGGLSLIGSKKAVACDEVASQFEGSDEDKLELLNESKDRCVENSQFQTRLGEAYLNLDKGELALASLDKAISLDPSNGLAYTLRGDYRDGNEQYSEAVSDYTQALVLAPTDEYTLYRRAGSRLSLNVNDLDAALADIEKALSLNKDAPNLARKGFILHEMGRFSDAVSAYDQAIQLDPSDASLYRDRAGSKLFLDRFSDALADVNKALRIDPKDAIAYQVRGNIQTWLEAFNAACEDFKMAKDLGYESTTLHPISGVKTVSIDDDIKGSCS